MGWMTALLAIGATARITRLIGRDSITFFFRDWIAGHSDSTPKPGARRKFFTFLEDLVNCPWCLSIWVSIPVAVAAWMWGDSVWFTVPALALSASWIAGHIATKEGS